MAFIIEYVYQLTDGFSANADKIAESAEQAKEKLSGLAQVASEKAGSGFDRLRQRAKEAAEAISGKATAAIERYGPTAVKVFKGASLAAGAGIAAAGAMAMNAERRYEGLKDKIIDFGVAAGVGDDQLSMISDQIIRMAPFVGQTEEALLDAMTAMRSLGSDRSLASLEAVARASTATGESVGTLSELAIGAVDKLGVAPENLEAFFTAVLGGSAQAESGMSAVLGGMDSIFSRMREGGMNDIGGFYDVVASAEAVFDKLGGSKKTQAGLDAYLEAISSPKIAEALEGLGVNLEGVYAGADAAGISRFHAFAESIQRLAANGADLEALFPDKKARQFADALVQGWGKYNDVVDKISGGGQTVASEFDRQMNSPDKLNAAFADRMEMVMLKVGEKLEPLITSMKQAFLEIFTAERINAFADGIERAAENVKAAYSAVVEMIDAAVERTYQILDAIGITDAASRKAQAVNKFIAEREAQGGSFSTGWAVPKKPEPRGPFLSDEQMARYILMGEKARAAQVESLAKTERAQSYGMDVEKITAALNQFAARIENQQALGADAAIPNAIQAAAEKSVDVNLTNNIQVDTRAEYHGDVTIHVPQAGLTKTVPLTGSARGTNMSSSEATHATP